MHNKIFSSFFKKKQKTNKIAFDFRPILNLAEGSALDHSKGLRNCSSASPLQRDVPDRRRGHSLAFGKERVATAANKWFYRETVDFFFLFWFSSLWCIHVLCKV